MAEKAISLIKLCSLLMACLFALSASFQHNDPDWYLWFPLYACGCMVNLVNGLGKSPGNGIVRPLAKFALWLGIFLFIKVALEDFQNGVAGFWSLNITERVVREKIGSGLVIGSMSQQLKAPPTSVGKQKSTKYSEYGVVILVGIGGLSFVFYLCHKKEMKF